MLPLNHPKQPSTKPVVDLTVSSPVASIPTSNILAGAFNALNNVPKNPLSSNTLGGSPFAQKTFFNPSTSSLSSPSNTKSIQSVGGSLLHPKNCTFIAPPPAPHILHKIDESNTNSAKPSFTSGIVDIVSLNYDANRLKNSEFHNNFERHFAEEIGKNMIPYDADKILNARRIKFEEAITREGVQNYADYNLFRQDDKKQGVIYKLFHPAFDDGIRDTHLFNYISRNILKQRCVGDVGIDILNFLHSLFIILYWNDRYFKLQLNESPMHGIVKLLQNLVPLQTCVWWLNLHHSLNKINQQANLPHIDFKNILTKQTEKNIFYSNLIKRLMSSGEQQANTWKDYLLHSQNNLDKFLYQEKRRRLQQIADDLTMSPFNKQLRNYIQQLLLPKLIIRCREMTDKMEKVLIGSKCLSVKCLKSRKYLAKNISSYFSDHDIEREEDDDDDSDDDVILMSNENKDKDDDDKDSDDDDKESTKSISAQKARTASPVAASFVMNDDERVSFAKYELLRKQAKRDRHRNNHHKKRKKKRKHRKKHKHHKRIRREICEEEEESMTSTEEMEQDEDEDDDEKSDIHVAKIRKLKASKSDPIVSKRRSRKRKRGEDSDDDPDFDPNEKQKVETRGRKKRKMSTNDNGKKRRKKDVAQKREEDEVETTLSCDEEEEDEDDDVIVELNGDGKICIDWTRKAIDRFLKCGLCHKCLAASIVTINECMHSFCEQCLNEYFEKCVKENSIPKCPKCAHDLGQGSTSSIWQRICKEDKLKMSLMELINASKQLNTT